ncbi:MAG: site-2 protease family protein [Patescibacteria group bacterium]
MDFIFQIAILIMSVVIHEVSHGFAAKAYGDNTALYQGRLTLNPVKHIDPVGSVLIPILSYMMGGFVFGWAKPVPYNPYNLKPGRWPEAFVSLAGPLSNICIAIIFSLAIRFVALPSGGFLIITSTIVYVNILLAIFNLMPIPPLDGSKLLFSIFPEKLYAMRGFFERYGLVLVIFFIFFAWQFVAPLVSFLFHFLTGLPI